MASVIKLIGLVLCMISLILEMKGFEALQSIAPLGNNRLSTACSFKDETLAMTTTELVGWYVVLIISLVKPGGFFSVLSIMGVLLTGFLSVIYTQITYGYVEQSGTLLEPEYLKMAALLNILGLFSLLGYCLDQLLKKVPGFD